MFHSCPTENSHGEHLVDWAYHIFGECIYNDRGKASIIIGLISIFCFAFELATKLSQFLEGLALGWVMI